MGGMGDGRREAVEPTEGGLVAVVDVVVAVVIVVAAAGWSGVATSVSSLIRGVNWEAGVGLIVRPSKSTGVPGCMLSVIVIVVKSIGGYLATAPITSDPELTRAD